MPRIKILKGDTVQVLSGKDRGKQGRVVRVYPDQDKAMVEGVNQVKRHEPVRQQRGRAGMTGGIMTKEMPVHISNIAVVCPSCGQPTRVGYALSEDTKERVCRKCGAKL